jgi:predicted permease
LPESGYREPEKRIAFYRAAVERLAALPGVTSAAAGMGLPFVGSGAAIFQIVGREARDDVPGPHGDVRWTTPGFFATLRIPLKRGRVFTDEDSAASQRVVLIDEDLARQYWPNEDPIGQQIQRNLRGAVPWTIVGIVAHVKQSDLAADPGKGVVYYPLYQQALPQSAVLIIRTATNPDTLVSGMREAIRSVDPAQPVYDIKTMESRVSATLGLRRFAVVLLGTFATLALLMAGIGLYGMINYLVNQRTQEIGIRVALGAEPLQVVGFVLGQGVRLTLSGIGIGLVVAVVLNRLIASQLFQVSPFAPATFAGVSIVILAVALVASYVPARRATKIDPLDACRHE